MSLTKTNTLAYYDTELIIVHDKGVNGITLFVNFASPKYTRFFVFKPSLMFV